MKKLFNYIIISIVLFSCSAANNARQTDTGPSRDDQNCELAFDGPNFNECSLQADWTIEASRAGFPENISLKINDVEYFNECSGNKYPFLLTRSSIIKLEAIRFKFPIGNLKLEIIDLGNNCLENKKFYLNPKQDYAMSGNSLNKLVVIKID